MPTVSEIALSLTGICTPVPPSGDGVCRICHGCPNPGWSTCWSCSNITGQLSRPCDLVVPVSLYEITSQLHHVLRHYKSDRYPHLHDQFGAQVVSLLSYFLTTNGDCIAEAAGWIANREGYSGLIRNQNVSQGMGFDAPLSAKQPPLENRLTVGHWCADNSFCER